jgi:hypothetical protein
VGRFGTYWDEKVWEESFLFMEEEVYAEWLGKLLGKHGAVKSAELPWGKVGVNVDKKGWSTSIIIVPNRQQ